MASILHLSYATLLIGGILVFTPPATYTQSPKASTPAKAKTAANTTSKNGTLENREFKSYRVVNWCVTGKDEPQLHDWPFNQFVPLIKRNRRYKQLDPDNNRYRLEIKEIYSRMPWIGATANCRGEELISTPKPEFPRPNVNTTTTPAPDQQSGPWCEPFQQCFDYQTNKSGTNPATFECDYINYEYYTSGAVNSSGGPAGGPTGGGPAGSTPMSYTGEPTLPPTTPGPIKTWNLTAAQDGIRAPEEVDCGISGSAKGCRPNMKNSSVFKTLGRLYKTVHITVYAEERRRLSHGIYEKWFPQKVEGILLQANHNPSGVGLPTGQFFMGEFHCLDCNGDHYTEIIPCRKRASIEVIHPTIAAFHHMMRVRKLPKALPLSGSPLVKYETEAVGKRSEMHVNFRWHSPPCTQTKRLEFTLMIVRSFKTGDFDVLRIGPHEVITRGQSYVPDIVPTPIFEAFFYDKRLQGTFCHLDDSPDIQTVDPPTFSRFDMSHSYDECVRDESNPSPVRKSIGDLTFEYAVHMCDTPRYPKCFPVKGFTGMRRHFHNERHFGSAELLQCPMPCLDGPTTQPTKTKKKGGSIFKREHHGGMLIMTNFCLMPVCSFIARFYKETFNISRIKGVKAWFWAHIVGSAMSTILIYFATFHAGQDFNRIPHVYIGKAYIMVLATTYFSAWGRHKTLWINQTAEFCHGVLGYVTIILAHINMHVAPGVGWVPKMLVDTQIGIHVLFILILTAHVQALDKKFGMRPSRRHLPTVEARFDDIPIPGYKFRVTCLIVLSVITFILSSVSLFVA